MISALFNLTRLRWINITLLALCIIGVVSFTQYFRLNEQKKRETETLNKGNYLANLLTLYPINTLNGERRDFFLKTLAEQFTSEGLVYCYILDRKGDAILSLNPSDSAYMIPPGIQKNALYTMGLTIQTFTFTGCGTQVHEFAKPIFENGQRAGTVRLGFKKDPISILPREYIGFPGMIAFFIIATWALVYYGAAFTLRPIRDRYGSMGKTGSNGFESSLSNNANPGMTPIIRDLERSFEQIKEIMKHADEDNMAITAKLGVMNFEKNQVSKIIDSLDLGIIITDIQGNIVNINAYMLNLIKKRRQT